MNIDTEKLQRQKNRVKTIGDIEPGTIFRIPGSSTRWKLLDEKAEKRGWNWSYWCTDGIVRKLFDSRKRVFVMMEEE
jgi:hypothetical protein